MSCVGETLRLWNNFPKTKNVPTIGLEHATMSSNVTFIRWKVHQDWVTKVKYFPSFSAVVSLSNDEASSVVIGILKGHSAPIFYLCISSEDGQIFSVSMDNTVKPKASLIHGDLSACLYSPFTKALFIAADHMSLLSLKTRDE
ncbi:hypothetical protein NHX12_009277, partial [Muraenolepis orangiensis]